MGLPTCAALVCLLATIPLGTVADVISRTSDEITGRGPKTYALEDLYKGKDFFTEWSFFNSADLDQGNVEFQSEEDAISQGLAYVDGNTFVVGIDSTSVVPSGGHRKSVRMTSNMAYTHGLFILDAAAMPVGCGTWPSFKTSGPNGLLSGEVDIVNGYNNQPNNQMALRSGKSNACRIDDSTSEKTFTGRVLNGNCYSAQNADPGCPILDPDTNSFGYGFNAAQGGVFAWLWENSGMSMWHFTRTNIPPDITNKNPTPANWGTPAGFWDAKTCDIADDFISQALVIETDICGDLAGPAYSSSGCPGTCSDMVANATNFVDAKWKINYVAVYQ